MPHPRLTYPSFRGTFFLLMGLCCLPGILRGSDETSVAKAKPATKGSVSFGLDVSQGNTEAFGFNAGFDFSWESATTAVRLTSDINYLQTDGEKKAERMSVQTTLDHRFGDDFTFFILGKPSRNVVQEIDFRLEAGLGFRYHLISRFDDHRKETPRTELSLSTAVIYEFTNRAESGSQRLARLSLRPKLKQELGANLALGIVFSAQPNMADFSDYRLLLESEIEFIVSSKISFLLRFDAEYNSLVPEGVEREDYRLINSLSIHL